MAEPVLALVTYFDPRLVFALGDEDSPCERTVVGWVIPAPEGFTWVAGERSAEEPGWFAITEIPTGCIKSRIPVDRIRLAPVETATA